jgi:uncharacterized protein YciI
MISQDKRNHSSIALNETGKGIAPLEDGSPPQKKQKVSSRIVIRPSDYALAAFRANGVNIKETRVKLTEKFIVPSEEMIKAYSLEVLEAVRNNDLDHLKKMHKESKLVVNACNKFGDSLLHLACRRSHTNIAEFLIKELKVNVNIRDDYHRTPLHDAAWTAEPNFDLVNLLIEEAPEHLLMKDVRGFMPFDYVRHHDWGIWLRFLWERKAMLRPNDAP